MDKEVRHIIFFDGICHFCNQWVNFVIRNDKKQSFYFAPLQSDFAKNTLKLHTNDIINPDSVIYSRNNKLLFKSSAAIYIFKELGGRFLLLFYMIVWIPPLIRNFLYDIIAKNRYKWFGKYEHCMMPNEKVKKRFL